MGACIINLIKKGGYKICNTVDRYAGKKNSEPLPWIGICKIALSFLTASH